jgi:DNA-binding CsgD family transcriptional regulator
VHLLERDTDLAALAGSLETLRSEGTGGVVLVEGPPGIGKTALLEAALELAGELTVLRARGSELEAVLAFGGARQLFAPPVLALDENEREVVFAGPAGLARPVLGLAEPSNATLGDPLYGLYWLAVELAERAPLVLAIDDLHWLDDESGRLAAYLAERIEGIAVLIVATARPDEPGAAHGPVTSLGRRGTIIRPAALSEAAVDTLLRRHGGGAVTGGNPLFVTELRRALDASPGVPLDELGPESIAKLVLSRVERLSPDAVALARAVALFPDAATVSDAAALAGIDEDAAADAADALMRAQVLADDELLRFLHPVMRRAVYDDLGRITRGRQHVRAAELLKARQAAPEAIAAQLLAGAPTGDLADMRLLVAAADEAQGRRALRAAARYLERALAEDVGDPEERAQMRGRLGRMLGMLGHPDAEATLRQAVAETSEPGARVDLAVDMAKIAASNGVRPQLLDELERLRANTELDPQRAVALDAMLANCSHETEPGRYRAASARIPRDLRGDTQAERTALSALAYGAFIANEPASVVRDLVLRGAGETGTAEYELGTDFDDSLPLLVVCGDLDTAEAFAQERLDHARETGAEAGYSWGMLLLADVEIARGNLRAAEGLVRLSVEAATNPRNRRFASMRLMNSVIARGDFREGEALLNVATENNPMADFARGDFAAARGDTDGVIAAYGRLTDLLDTIGIISPTERRWTLHYAEALAARGRGDEALEVMHEFHARAEAFGVADVVGIGHLGVGRHTPGAEGLDRMRSGHALLEASPFRYWAARARLELGARLRRENERAEARELMLPALEYAERQHLAPLAQRLRDELRLVGARPRNVVRSGVDSLTPSEERIARLAAGGASNKEIAQQLFLTVKTIETHLGSAYRKLDIRTRRDLAAAFAQRPD